MDLINPIIEFSGYNPLAPLCPWTSNLSYLLQDRKKNKRKKNLFLIFKNRQNRH